LYRNYRCYSFDPIDVERYDLKFIPNFYSYEDRTTAYEYDVYFLGSYADIVHYDFYNPNNIFIWNQRTLSIPEGFFTSPYQELSETVYKKYRRECWVKTVLGLPGATEHSRLGKDSL